MKKNPIILGIETSCDETAAAIIEGEENNIPKFTKSRDYSTWGRIHNRQENMCTHTHTHTERERDAHYIYI